jgi:fructoselysine-6-P-deglycase FrlB-like protein
MEMLGPDVGVLQFRSDEPATALIESLSAAAVEAGSPVVILDCSGAARVPGAVSIELPRASDIAALFVLLPVAQRLMVSFAAARVRDVGTPCRSAKITRTE